MPVKYLWDVLQTKWTEGRLLSHYTDFVMALVISTVFFVDPKTGGRTMAEPQ